MSTVAIILAADDSEGFPTSRFTTEVRGTGILDAVVADALEWPVDEVLVVLGADAEQVEERCDLSQVSVLVDPEWAEGAAAPLRAALDLLSRDRAIDRCVIARGDQPGIMATTIEGLLDMYDDSRPDAVTTKYRYAPGWPVVVARRFWDVFLGLEGEMDIHDVIASHASASEEFWVGDLAPTAYQAFEDLPTSRF